MSDLFFLLYCIVIILFSFSACNELGVVFSKKYHPGVWTTKTRRYTCCDSINKADQGCQASTASANVNANVKTREQNGKYPNVCPHNTETFLYKTWKTKVFFQFAVIINVLASSFGFIGIPMSNAYDFYIPYFPGYKTRLFYFLNHFLRLVRLMLRCDLSMVFNSAEDS